MVSCAVVYSGIATMYSVFDRVEGRLCGFFETVRV